VQDRLSRIGEKLLDVELLHEAFGCPISPGEDKRRAQSGLLCRAEVHLCGPSRPHAPLKGMKTSGSA
jgi:hypothetical protein